jgi:hypothetical protein
MNYGTKDNSNLLDCYTKHDAMFEDEIIWDMIGHLEFREFRVDMKLHAF